MYDLWWLAFVWQFQKLLTDWGKIHILSVNNSTKQSQVQGYRDILCFKFNKKWPKTILKTSSKCQKNVADTISKYLIHSYQNTGIVLQNNPHSTKRKYQTKKNQIKILKAFLPFFFFIATCSEHVSNLISLTILGERYKRRKTSSV